MLPKILGIVLTLSLTLLACTQLQKKLPRASKQLIINGIIKNAKQDTIYIKEYGDDTIRSIYINELGKFSDTFNILDGEYLFYSNNYSTPIYLSNNYNLEFNYDMSNIDSTLTIKGTGANDVNYWIDKSEFRNQNFEFTYYMTVFELNEESFLERIDSIKKLKTSFLNSYSKLSKSLKSLELSNIHYSYLNDINMYEGAHGWRINDSTYKVSSNFPEKAKTIVLNDTSLLKSDNYIQYLISYIATKTKDRTEGMVERDWGVEMLKTTKSLIKNKKVKTAAIKSIYNSNKSSCKDPATFFSLLKEMTQDSLFLLEIDKEYQQQLKRAPGTKVANFNFENIDGEKIALSDFENKNVVIDIWASWCGPCLIQTPHFEKSKEKFKEENIVFISINRMDDKTDWKNTVKSKNMSGIQLFAEENNPTTFFNDLSIYGMPTFVLLDKDHKIVNHNYAIPSSNKFNAGIKSLLDSQK